ncbi:MAG TPA: CDP-alcohol phosphatidyltransferase family protein [Chthoniobacterales bacterium]
MHQLLSLPGRATHPSGPGQDRRPIPARNSPWAGAVARRLASAGITPNQISLASIVAAAFAAGGLCLLPQPWSALVCIAGVQLRLLCNLLDGMVAVEHGRGSRLGPLYNDVPDRVSDALVLVALGYAAGAGWLGWLAALAATGTAYLRLFGGALGFKQDFRGPMAKPHRMAALTAGCAAAMAEHFISGTHHALLATVAAIAAGSLLTCATRLQALTLNLRKGS